ncbi:hypothetical protein ACLB2K_053471 [Fragaria x ananassa]
MDVKYLKKTKSHKKRNKKVCLYIHTRSHSETYVCTVLKVRTSLRSPLSSADDGASPPREHHRHPISLSLPGEIDLEVWAATSAQNFRQDRSRRKTVIRRTRRGEKVIGDASGVRSGRGALSLAPNGGERRDIHTLRVVRTSAPNPACY